MDTTYHSNIPIETLSLLDCDVKNFNFIHPIKNIFFDNIDYIRKLDASGKARPCILDNVERWLLCPHVILALISLNVRIVTTGILFHILVIQDSVMPVVLNMPSDLRPKPLLFCLDCPHRHIVFTIPEELRNWFRQDRTQLNLLFVASRNTISILTNKSLADKLKKKKIIGYPLYIQRHSCS